MHQGQVEVNGNEMVFPHKSILTADQFMRNELECLFAVTDDLRANPVDYRGVLSRDGMPLDATVFFTEPSTRTFSSYMKAFQFVGADVLGLIGGEYSSMAKGESLEDTMMTLEALGSDVVVLRHSEEGSAAVAAEHLNVPLVNGGDGPGEHPSQGILDLYTIRDRMGRLDDLRVTMVGDILKSRTLHSDARMLALYNGNHVSYVSPEESQVPDDLFEELATRGLSQSRHEDLEEVLPETDVLIVVRPQKERYKTIDDKGNEVVDEERFEKIRDAYRITPELMSIAAKDMIVCHPFPRNDEIARSFDTDPRAVYKQMISHGKSTRVGQLVLGFETRAMPRRIEIPRGKLSLAA